MGAQDLSSPPPKPKKQSSKSVSPRSENRSPNVSPRPNATNDKRSRPSSVSASVFATGATQEESEDDLWKNAARQGRLRWRAAKQTAQAGLEEKEYQLWGLARDLHRVEILDKTHHDNQPRFTLGNQDSELDEALHLRILERQATLFAEQELATTHRDTLEPKTPFSRLHADHEIKTRRMRLEQEMAEDWHKHKEDQALDDILGKTRRWKKSDLLTPSASAERLHGDRAKRDKLKEEKEKQKEQEEKKNKPPFQPTITKRKGADLDELFGGGNNKTVFDRLFDSAKASKARKSEARKENEDDKMAEIKAAIKYGNSKKTTPEQQKAFFTRMHADHEKHKRRCEEKAIKITQMQEDKIWNDAMDLLELPKTHKLGDWDPKTRKMAWELEQEQQGQEQQESVDGEKRTPSEQSIVMTLGKRTPSPLTSNRGDVPEHNLSEDVDQSASTAPAPIRPGSSWQLKSKASTFGGTPTTPENAANEAEKSGELTETSALPGSPASPPLPDISEGGKDVARKSEMKLESPRATAAGPDRLKRTTTKIMSGMGFLGKMKMKIQQNMEQPETPQEEKSVLSKLQQRKSERERKSTAKGKADPKKPGGKSSSPSPKFKSKTPGQKQDTDSEKEQATTESKDLKDIRHAKLESAALAEEERRIKRKSMWVESRSSPESRSSSCSPSARTPLWQRGAQDYRDRLIRREIIRQKAVEAEDAVHRMMQNRSRSWSPAQRTQNYAMASRSRNRQRSIEAEVNKYVKERDQLEQKKIEEQQAVMDVCRAPGLKILAFMSANLERRFGLQISVNELQPLREIVSELHTIYSKAVEELKDKDFLYYKKACRIPEQRLFEGKLRTAKEVDSARRPLTDICHERDEHANSDEDFFKLAGEVQDKIKHKIAGPAASEWFAGNKVGTEFCEAASAYDPGVKTPERLASKSMVKFGHKKDRKNLIFDLVRLTLEFQTCHAMVEGLTHLRQHFNVIEVRNRFHKPSLIGSCWLEVLCSEEDESAGTKVIFEIRLEHTRFQRAKHLSARALRECEERIHSILKAIDSEWPPETTLAIDYLLQDTLFGPPEETRLRNFRRMLEQNWGTIPSAWRRAIVDSETFKANWSNFMSVINDLKLHERWYTLWDGLTQGTGAYITLWDLDPFSYQKLLRLQRLILPKVEDSSQEEGYKKADPFKAFSSLVQDGQAAWQQGLTLIEFCNAMKKRRFVDDAKESFTLLERYGGTRGGAYVRPEDIVWLSLIPEIPLILDKKDLVLEAVDAESGEDRRKSGTNKSGSTRKKNTLGDFLQEHDLSHMEKRLRQLGATHRDDLDDLNGIDEEDLLGEGITNADVTKLLQKLGLIDNDILEITVDKTKGQTFGVTFQRLETSWKIKAVQEAGLIWTWNKNNPNLEVKPDDCIIEVNGIHGDTHAIADELKKNIVMHVKIQQASKQVGKQEEGAEAQHDSAEAEQAVSRPHPRSLKKKKTGSLEDDSGENAAANPKAVKRAQSSVGDEAESSSGSEGSDDGDGTETNEETDKSGGETASKQVGKQPQSKKGAKPKKK